MEIKLNHKACKAHFGGVYSQPSPNPLFGGVTRVKCYGSTSVFQTDSAGSTPVTRSRAKAGANHPLLWLGPKPHGWQWDRRGGWFLGAWAGGFDSPLVTTLVNRGGGACENSRQGRYRANRGRDEIDRGDESPPTPSGRHTKLVHHSSLAHLARALH